MVEGSKFSIFGEKDSAQPDLKKRKKKRKLFSRTYRFEIILNPPSDGKSNYKNIDWLDLVAKEEEAKIAAKVAFRLKFHFTGRTKMFPCQNIVYIT